jgi:16S rRNA (guanine1207-N2)-methyltransferase
VIDPARMPAGLEIDRLWSNPPIRIGKPALHELLDTWFAALAPYGSAHLVVQKHLGADSLASRLSSRGWRVHRRAARKAYRLLDVDRSPQALGEKALGEKALGEKRLGEKRQREEHRP